MRACEFPEDMNLHSEKGLIELANFVENKPLMNRCVRAIAKRLHEPIQDIKSLDPYIQLDLLDHADFSTFNMLSKHIAPRPS